MLDPKCIYQKSIFAKCTQLAWLLSFVSLFHYHILRPENFTLKSAKICDKNSLATNQRESIFCVKLHTDKFETNIFGTNIGKNQTNMIQIFEKCIGRIEAIRK